MSFLSKEPIPCNEIEKKQAKLKDMAERRKAELEFLRKIARRYIYQNKSMASLKIPNVVTADDVRMIAGIKRQPRQNGKGNRFNYTNNFMGCLFRDKRFVCVTDTYAKSDGRHGSKIGIWTLKKYEKSVRKYLVEQELAAIA